MPDDKIVVEFEPNEIEMLCGAIAHFVPDKGMEMKYTALYFRLKKALEEFERNA